jgi:hypothetical protein
VFTIGCVHGLALGGGREEIAGGGGSRENPASGVGRAEGNHDAVNSTYMT